MNVYFESYNEARQARVIRRLVADLKEAKRNLGYADKAAEAYERQRDALLVVIEDRVGIIEPVTDCDCMDCTALRKAREIVKSSEEKL